MLSRNHNPCLTRSFIMTKSTFRHHTCSIAMTHIPNLARPVSPLVANTDLIKSYFDRGLLSDARRVFARMTERDVVTWTAMISGYASNSRPNEAWTFFCAMDASGVAINAFTINSVLTACKAMEFVAGIAAVHAIAFRRGVEDQPHVEHALLDAYARCAGGMNDALKVFGGISQKNAVSWTTIVSAYVHRGDGSAAAQMCHRMFQRKKKMKYTVQVESGRTGKNGEPSVGPIYRSSLAKDGFPPLEPSMSTSWEIFRVAAQKFSANRMLGWREFTNGKAGPYMWKTFKEVYEEVLHIGSALRQLNVAPGSRIGIYGANCPQWAVAMEACNGYSLICVPLYDTLGESAVGYIIEHAEIDVVFVQDKKVKQILSSDCKAARRLKAIISFTTFTKEQNDPAAAFGTKAYSWNDFILMGKEYPSEPLPPKPLDICTIMYTSGTSGNPKGVVLTHETHATYVKGVDLFMDQFEDKMTVDDVYFSFLPLAHILDRMVEEYFFRKGASVGYYQGDIQALRDDLVELKPTFFAGVPRVFEKVHEGILKAVAELRPLRRMIFNLLYKNKLHWMRLGYSHKTASPFADFLAFGKVKARLGGRVRLLVSGGAPLNPEIEEFLRVTSCAYLTQGYGLTETCGQTTIGFPDDLSLIGTVGVTTTYTELRLEEVPEMGYDPLAEPSRGEICVRGKTLFSGYYKNPELTKEVFIDGWFHTGDIGEIRPDGVLIVIDRKKNIFKLSQGEYVAAEYLEKVYSSTPIIEDIWVHGDSCQSMLVAVVTPHEDNTKNWASLKGHKGSFPELCALKDLNQYILQELKIAAEKNKLKGFEYIRGIVVDPLPFDIDRELVTPTMKKKRSQMLKHYKVEIERLYKNLAQERK